MLDRYVAQARPLPDTLPDIADEAVFALKGGTAINLFHGDMPKLSVDIDRTCLPLADRQIVPQGNRRCPRSHHGDRHLQIPAPLDRAPEQSRKRVSRGFAVAFLRQLALGAGRRQAPNVTKERKTIPAPVPGETAQQRETSVKCHRSRRQGDPTLRSRTDSVARMTGSEPEPTDRGRPRSLQTAVTAGRERPVPPAADVRPAWDHPGIAVKRAGIRVPKPTQAAPARIGRSQEARIPANEVRGRRRAGRRRHPCTRDPRLASRDRAGMPDRFERRSRRSSRSPSGPEG